MLWGSHLSLTRDSTRYKNSQFNVSDKWNIVFPGFQGNRVFNLFINSDTRGQGVLPLVAYTGAAAMPPTPTPPRVNSGLSTFVHVLESVMQLMKAQLSNDYLAGLIIFGGASALRDWFDAARVRAVAWLRVFVRSL